MRLVDFSVRAPYLPSTIEADKDGIALIAAACDKLSNGPYRVDELWPGKSYNLYS